jgi:hypothetical protein
MSMSLLDPGQVLKMAADEADQAIRVNVVAQSGASPTTEILDGVGGVNKAQVSAANALKVDGSGVTQPVSAVSLPLPTGASTSALQTSGNTSLSSIDTKTPALGQTTMAASSPVVIASNQSVLRVSTSTATAGTITQAAITVGTSAVRLTVSGAAPASTRILLAAVPDSSSTAKFYIGSVSVTNSGATRGFQLLGGQAFIANNDAGDYYIVSDTAAQTVLLTEQS